MKNKTFRARSLYWASFNCFELRLPGAAINDIAQSGANDQAVAAWVDKVEFCTAIDGTPRATPDAIREELEGHGAWDAEELADDAANRARIVWIAAWNIFEEESPDCSAPVSSKKRA